MGKPTRLSVTDLPCSCGYLFQKASDVNSPVRFDSALNEYHLDYKLPSGATYSLALYHCPMCGGVASDSKRDAAFVALPEQEARRVNDLIRDLHTIDDIERKLGTPDTEQTVAVADLELVQPRTGKAEPGPVRVLSFRRLSKMADVQFTVYSNGEIEAVIAPKQK